MRKQETHELIQIVNYQSNNNSNTTQHNTKKTTQSSRRVADYYKCPLCIYTYIYIFIDTYIYIYCKLPMGVIRLPINNCPANGCCSFNSATRDKVRSVKRNLSQTRRKGSNLNTPPQCLTLLDPQLAICPSWIQAQSNSLTMF